MEIFCCLGGGGGRLCFYRRTWINLTVDAFSVSSVQPAFVRDWSAEFAGDHEQQQPPSLRSRSQRTSQANGGASTHSSNKKPALVCGRLPVRDVQTGCSYPHFFLDPVSLELLNAPGWWMRLHCCREPHPKRGEGWETRTRSNPVRGPRRIEAVFLLCRMNTSKREVCEGSRPPASTSISATRPTRAGAPSLSPGEANEGRRHQRPEWDSGTRCLHESKDSCASTWHALWSPGDWLQ